MIDGAPVSLFRFGEWTLDTTAGELRGAEGAVRVEPRVFDLLVFFASNPGRVVSKDELVATLWQGRVVSDTAITSCVKAARRALGDDGISQRYFKTVHKRGYRFEPAPDTPRSSTMVTDSDTASRDGRGPEPATTPNRPSLAVLPLELVAEHETHALLGRAIAHDVIQALSRMRWLDILARASTFRLAEHGDPLAAARDRLGARYALGGVLIVTGPRLCVDVELTDLDGMRIIWSERLECSLDDVQSARNELVERVLSSVELQIPQHEARRATLLTTDQLDAWSAFHLGLVRLYAFNRRDTDEGLVMLDRAIALDPHFARAHAARSFGHFQIAFNRYDGTAERRRARDEARRSAERALELDRHDPFGTFVYGRSFWLDGEVERSLDWLRQATEICPSFAQGHYALGLAALMADIPFDSRAAADRAARLSPLDPLGYGFLGVRAFADIAEGRHARAARLADQAANAVGALVVMDLLAGAAHDLAGNAEAAEQWFARARERKPDIDTRFFFKALPFAHRRIRSDITSALARHGFQPE